MPEGRQDFDTLGWLTYGNLMLGKVEEAAKNVEAAKAAADRNPDNRGIRDGYLGMRARYIQESGKWEKIPLPAEAVPSGDAPAAMPGMNMGGGADVSEGATSWIYIAGVSAAKLGDLAAADAALARLAAIRERAEHGGSAYAARPHAIREKELSAIVLWAKGQKDAALADARAATETEATMAAPSGPPDPLKPAFELYAELLADAGRDKEAAAAFEQALLRTPNRTPSVQGLAKVTARLKSSMH